MGLRTDSPQWLVEYQRRIRRERRDMVLAVVRDKVRAGVDDPAIDACLSVAEWQIESESRRDGYERMLAVIREIQNTPDGPQRVAKLFWRAHDLMEWDSAEFRDLLDKVAALPNPRVAAVARDAKQYVLAGGRAHGARVFNPDRYARLPPPPRPASATRPTSQPAPPPADLARADPVQEVAFEPIDLRIVHADHVPTPPQFVTGMFPAGDGVDVVQVGRHLCLMKEKGKLEPVEFGEKPNPDWETGADLDSLTAACYDGRYVWAVVRRRRVPSLAVIDPTAPASAGLVAEVTIADGLPLVATDEADSQIKRFGIEVRVAPLEPGRVCVVGHGGTPWIAVVTFEPAAGKSVKVFHEARAFESPRIGQPWQSADVTYRPRYVIALTEPSGAATGVAGATTPSTTPVRDGNRTRHVVIVGRRSGSRAVDDYPLLVDPDAMTVRVAAGEAMVGDSLGRGVLPMFGHAGVIYTLYGPFLGHQTLWRFGYPDFTKRLVAENPFPGDPAYMGNHMVFHNGRVLIAGKQWATAPSPEGPYHLLRGEVPERGVSIARARPNEPPPPHPVGFGPNSPPGTEIQDGVYTSAHYGLVLVTNIWTQHKFYQVQLKGGAGGPDAAKPLAK